MLAFAIIMIILGILSSVCLTAYLKSKNVNVSIEPKEDLPAIEREYFGFHFRPYYEIKRHLPKAPANYMWELEISEDSRYININLLELQSEKKVATKAVDLYKVNSQSWTVAREYSDFARIAKEAMWKEKVVQPIGWANHQIVKFNKEFSSHKEIVT